MTEDFWLLELRAELAGHGLFVGRDPTVAATGNSFLVRGDTYRAEPLLTGVGAAWDGAVSAWRLASLVQLAALAAALRPEAATGTVTYGTPRDGMEASGLREDHGSAPAGDEDRRVGRRGDPLIRRLARLPTEVLDPEELLQVMVGLGTGFPEPRRLAGRLLERFRSLGAVLAAESVRYAECLPPDDEAAWPDRDRAAWREERHWELSTLLKTTQELLQRVLREELEERPVIGSWTALVDYLAAAMRHETAEHFRILFLDRKNILIRDEVQSRGTVDQTSLYPREVVKRALELAASAIVMVHNHPSGDPTPSAPDVEMTKQVVAALGQVGIAVHDHIIVGKNRHASFRNLKLL